MPNTTGEWGLPNDANSHLFMSMRACPRSGGSCAGGILEVSVDHEVENWWVKSNQEGVQASLRKPDGTLFSDECMPIAVTSVGEQTKQYLVVGDPSWDELSVFNALRLWEGPLDSIRVSDATANIKALAVEGRREGSLDIAFLSVLWSSSSSARVEHRAIANGTFYGDTPQLTETVPVDVRFIESQGMGAQSTSADLLSYGSRVIRRRYRQ